MVSLLTGREPAGTLQWFYPAFDVVLGLCLLLVRGLFRLVRSGSASPIAWSARSRLGRVRFVGGQTFRLYLDVFVPLVLLLKTPDALGASSPPSSGSISGSSSSRSGSGWPMASSGSADTDWGVGAGRDRPSPGPCGQARATAER